MTGGRRPFPLTVLRRNFSYRHQCLRALSLCCSERGRNRRIHLRWPCPLPYPRKSLSDDKGPDSRIFPWNLLISRRLRSGRRTSLSTLRPYRKLFLLSYSILHCQRIDISLRLFKSLTSPFWRISEKLCIPIGYNISSAISSNSANIQILTDTNINWFHGILLPYIVFQGYLA